MLVIKGLVIGILLVILYCLGSGVYYLVKPGLDETHPTKLAKAFTWRIALSIGLFLLLLIAFYFGWIHPHQIV